MTLEDIKYPEKKVPLDSFNDVPLEVLGQYPRGGKSNRKYTRMQEIEILATKQFIERKMGLQCRDLLAAGLAKHKANAQAKVKRCVAAKILFAPEHRKPQKYYPTSLKSEVMKLLLQKIYQKNPQGLPPNTRSFSRRCVSKHF